MALDRHYDVSFLDALHTYFPAILYGEPEQFGGAAELVRYIQTQVQQRFDLFSSGRRTYNNTNQVLQTPPRAQPRAQPRPIPPRTANTGLANIATLLTAIDTGYTLHENTINTSILNSIFGVPNVIRNPIPEILEPVVVRPTPSQIAAGTQLELVDANDENCAICQDRMEPGSEARVIRVCDHRFHTECIDTWFQRSVLCPTCRHDIRDEPVD